MTKVMFVLHKRPDMGWQEFQRYWKEIHAPLVAKLPGLRAYIQNQVLPDVNTRSGQELVDQLFDPPFSGISELCFDNTESMQEARASAEGMAVKVDGPNFLDNDKTRMIVVEEVTVV